jgi:hypothetical protein
LSKNNVVQETMAFHVERRKSYERTTIRAIGVEEVRNQVITVSIES